MPELRVAVGYDHLRDRSPVEHRPVLQAHLVQGQPLAGIEADPHRPVLPAQRVPVQGEAGPLGLGDLDGLERGAVRASDGLVVVVAGFGRHRELEVVGDLEDLLLDQVYVGGESVDGVRPGQVVLALLDERQHPDHPAPVVLGRPERARGDRAGPDLAEVVVAPPGHGGAPVRVGLGDLVHAGEVALQDRHLAVPGRVQGARADHFPVGERHDHVRGLAAVEVDQERAQPSVAGRAGQHLVLGRLLQAVVGEPDGLGEQASRHQDVPAGQVLLRARRVERMRATHRPRSIRPGRRWPDRV